MSRVCLERYRAAPLLRRHVLGGAAVTEEVFPGFRFSVCSYVVSLLRPDIIRELDLPRHGLEIPPLDGRSSSGLTAVGRDLFVVGGERWESSDDGELLGEAWLWRAPGR